MRKNLVNKLHVKEVALWFADEGRLRLVGASLCV